MKFLADENVDKAIVREVIALFLFMVFLALFVGDCGPVHPPLLPPKRPHRHPRRLRGRQRRLCRRRKEVRRCLFNL